MDGQPLTCGRLFICLFSPRAHKPLNHRTGLIMTEGGRVKQGGGGGGGGVCGFMTITHQGVQTQPKG